MNEFEMFLLIDHTGERAVGLTEENARENYENEIGALNECDGFRIVKVCVKACLPVISERAVVVDGDTASVVV